MRLFPVFSAGPGSSRMGHASNYGLSARVDMDMFDDDALLTPATKLGQRIHLGCECFCQSSNRKRI
jgi:hypothetical protein